MIEIKGTRREDINVRVNMIDVVEVIAEELLEEKYNDLFIYEGNLCRNFEISMGAHSDVTTEIIAKKGSAKIKLYEHLKYIHTFIQKMDKRLENETK